MAYELNEGQGTLFRNDKKPEGSKQPDYRGEAKLDGVLMEVAGWLKDGKNGKWMSLSIKPKDSRPEASPREMNPDADIPF
jgi:hypothetical protein